MAVSILQMSELRHREIKHLTQTGKWQSPDLNPDSLASGSVLLILMMLLLCVGCYVWKGAWVGTIDSLESSNSGALVCN